MGDLNFNQDFLTTLADHRGEFITTVFQAITFMGGVEGYLLMVAVLFAMVSKRLAFQATIVVLVTGVINHLLKVAIQNPRPFVTDGTYMQEWAVSADRAARLVTEYSTPSGHAMGAAAFYLFLIFRARSNLVRAFLFLAFVLIGISRPVLGVHYVEDVLLGWALGAGLAVFFDRYIDTLLQWWESRPTLAQLAAGVTLSAAVWLATLLLTGQPANTLPTEFVSVLGFLTGTLLVVSIEQRHINYSAQGASLKVRVVRLLLMVSILGGALVASTALAGFASDTGAFVQTLVRYAKYTSIAMVCLLGAPWLFKRFNMSG